MLTSAKTERIERENDYLLARAIEVDEELKDAVRRLTAMVDNLERSQYIDLLKVSQVAEAFQIPEERVYELVKAHRLPVVKLGYRQLRFDRIALRRWLDRQVQEGDHGNDDRGDGG